MDPFSHSFTTEYITSDTPSLSLPIDEAELVTIINQVISESQTRYGEKRIKERQTTNRRYWRGQQVDTTKLDTTYQTAHVDNVVYQNEENRITLASSRLPEITLAPPDENPDTIERTKRAERSLRNRIDSNTIKRLIKDGLRQHDLDLLACIKVYWDKNRGKNGDYVFRLVDPRSLIFSSRSKIVHDGFTAENCDIIIEWIEEPTQLVLSKFPKKRQQLETMWGMSAKPQKMQYAEAHFSWYDAQGQRIEGVAWKYGNVMMDVSKTPYFDYEGVPFVNSEKGTIDNKKRNHFDFARKPYILFSYQNLGEWVYDDTTPFEQAIKINSIVNRRERQITEIADRTIPKMVFGSGAFKSGDAEKYVAKMNNPRDHIQLTGKADDVKKAVMVVQGAPPDQVLYMDANVLRGRIDSLFNTHGTTRGEIQGAGQSGISKQITREGDLTISDDIVDFMVERVVFEMASWGLQMSKMYYTTPRKIRDLGSDGEIQFGEVSTEDIDDDILPIVKASSTDPQIRRSNSGQFVSAKVIDPFTLFEDMDVTNPKERVRRWVSFMRGNQDMWRGYLDMLGIEDDMFDPGAQARKDIEKLKKGESVEPPAKLSQEYVQVIAQFKQSGQLEQLPPDAQQRFQEYIQQLKQSVDEQANAAQQQPPQGQSGQQPPAAGVPAPASPQGLPAPAAA